MFKVYQNVSLVALGYSELFWSWYTCLESQTQTTKISKVLKLIHLKMDKSSPFVVPELWEWCFELFRMQNSHSFLELHLWNPLGRAYSAPRTPQQRNSFSPCYTYRKTVTPQNVLDTALGSNTPKNFLRILSPAFLRFTMNKKRNSIDYHLKP